MSMVFPNFQLNPNIQANTAVNSALNTLQGLNAARTQYLNNQALQQQVPYAGQQAAANLGLTEAQTGLVGAQAQYFPLTATGQFLNGLGRLGYSVRPGAAYTGLPKTLADTLAARNIQGTPNVGAITNPNLGLANSIGGLLSGILPQFGAANSAITNLGGQPSPQMPPVSQSMPQPNGAVVTSQPTVNQPLPVTPAQTQRLQTLFGSNDGNQNTAGVVNQLNTSAQNAVASPALIQKYNFAQNLEKTIANNEKNFGNPAIVFAPYMGAKGAARLAADRAKAATGNASPEYEKYRAYEDSVPVLSEQLTQFLGGSVQPQVQEQLEELQNPVTWDKTPGTAYRIYNNLKDIIYTEGMTAAQTVGQTNQYQQNFPSFNPQQTYEELAANPQYAQDVIAAMPPAERAQLLAYHNQLKGRKNA